MQAERRLTSGDSLRFASLLTLFLVVLAGAAQHAASEPKIGSLWDGVWWAVVTVTTVGYGDLYPATVQGRLVGMVLMFTGIAFLALLTAAVASRWVTQERSEEREEAEQQRNEMMDTLRRIEADVTEVKSRVAGSQ